MFGLFLILFVLSFLGIFAAVLHPSLIPNNTSRKKAGLIFLGATFLFFVLSAITAPPAKPISVTQQTENKVESQQLIKEVVPDSAKKPDPSISSNPVFGTEPEVKQPPKTTAPVVEKSTSPIPVQPVLEQGTNGGWTCNCKKTCSQISSCEEAQYQLNTCGCRQRDADHDGIACDNQCQ